MTIGLLCGATQLQAQSGEKSLEYYLDAAQQHSPLLQDYRHQMEMQRQEGMRLKALYTKARVELSGDYLFVPVIAHEQGHTSFKWNAQDGTDYQGYDLGQSSGHLQAGLTWTQPLLGKSLYQTAQEQTETNRHMLSYKMKLEKHQLERSVTEQYLLCLLDKAQIDYADSTDRTLGEQAEVVQGLIQAGFAKMSDSNLLSIERERNREARTAALQSYRSHLADLNILCGIPDTAVYELASIDLPLRPAASGFHSSFMEQYRLDSLLAVTGLKTFRMQYKPQLNLFADTGMRTGVFQSLQRRFGVSAGLTFSWLLWDGRQRRYKERQTEEQLGAIRAYRTQFQTQNEMRKHQYMQELQDYDTRYASLKKQLDDYNRLLTNYRKEIQAGQLSTLDYLTVLRNKIQTERDYLLLRTNRQLLIVAFNYWNW